MPTTKAASSATGIRNVGAEELLTKMAACGSPGLRASQVYMSYRIVDTSDPMKVLR